MPELVPVLNRKAIEDSLLTVAKQISKDYQGRELVMIGVLKGAFIFFADLIRCLTIPVKIDFVRVASYAGGTSSGSIRLSKDVEIDLKGKDVLIVEDITDTGLTLEYLKNHFSTLGANSVKICVFIDKKERREKHTAIDYVCHVVEKGFLVGYGLDYAEDYRGLPEVYHLKL